MAYYPAIRIFIALTAATARAVKWAQEPGVESTVRFGERMQRRFQDPAESDAQLSQDASAESGRLVDVATYSSTFEMRKLQMLWTRGSNDQAGEDDAVVTIHFLKVAGGVPSSTWLAGDFTALETSLTTWWNSIKTMYPTNLIWRELRWYRSGPQRDEELGGPGRTGPPVRIVSPALPGTSTSGASWNSPQVAISVTEKTSDPKAWGRMYLPGDVPGSMANYGRISTARLTTLADATDVLLEAALTNNTPVVVYSPAKAARETKRNTTLPASVARALTVDELQIDDIYDVIRSRRWNKPLLRVQRKIGA